MGTEMNTEDGYKPDILIVDDNTTNIEVLAAALIDDYEIHFATSGAEGISLALATQPDLILLDIMMPEMDGFEACRQIRSQPPISNVPVIFISALEDTADKVAAFRAGGNDYVTKPFQPEEVLARVATHTALYRARRELEAREDSLRSNLVALEEAHRQMKEMGSQLLQSEKLASIGQLAAGVAHEINNPIGFVNSNLNSLKDYVETLLQLLDEYSALESDAAAEKRQHIETLKHKADLNFLRQDIGELIDESIEGTARVRRIVQDLRDFSHPGDAEWRKTDLRQALESTLNVARNEIKYKADIIRDYVELPPVECLASQINQVLLNLLVNAAQAIQGKGHITLRTRCEDGWVSIAVADTGCGIPEQHLEKIFDPFFTTKPVGKGTGLGLSMSYGIVAKHGGRIDVESELGKGTTITIMLPVDRREPSGN